MKHPVSHIEEPEIDFKRFVVGQHVVQCCLRVYSVFLMSIQPLNYVMS